jgi:hypothetical protein
MSRQCVVSETARAMSDLTPGTMLPGFRKLFESMGHVLHDGSDSDGRDTHGNSVIVVS